MNDIGLMEAGSSTSTEPRVRFSSEYKGTLEEFFEIHHAVREEFEELCEKLRDNLRDLEDYGVTPVMPDGKIGGNGGAVLTVGGKEFLVVSKSGKLAHHVMDIHQDFVIVETFSMSEWMCEYYSSQPDVKATSDTPLYCIALLNSRSLGWKSVPHYMLHGHAFATEEEAKAMGLPISDRPTLCSTPEDSEALLEIMKKYPFPENKMYIRKGHGFVLLGTDAKDAWEGLEKHVKPYLEYVKRDQTYQNALMHIMLTYIPLFVYNIFRT